MNHTYPVPDLSDMVMDDIWMMQDQEQRQHHHHQQHAPNPPPSPAAAIGEIGAGGGGFDTFMLDPMTGHFQMQQQLPSLSPLPLPSHHHRHTRSQQDLHPTRHHKGQSDNDDDEEEEEEFYASDSDFVIDEDDLSSLDEDRSNHQVRTPYLPPSIMNGMGSPDGMSTHSSYPDGSVPHWAAGYGTGGGSGRSHGRGGARGNGGRGRRKGSLDVQQMTRRLKQKAESYERKKSRAKACRKVLKERFDTLLKVCGDPHIRRSDKVGLLTRAINLITTMRQQLGGAGGAFFDVQRPPTAWRGGGNGHHYHHHSQGTRRSKRTIRGSALSAASTNNDDNKERDDNDDENGERQPGKRGCVNRVHSRKSPTRWIPVSMIQHQQNSDPTTPSPQTFTPPSTPTTSFPANMPLKERLATPKVTHTLLACLNSAFLEPCRDVVPDKKEPTALQDVPWKEICRMRWKAEEAEFHEELHPTTTIDWRHVYVQQARALRLPHSPNFLSIGSVVSSGESEGVCGWLLARTSSYIPLPSPVGSSSAPQALLSFILVMQNITHDMITIPHQRFEVHIKRQVPSQQQKQKQGPRVIPTRSISNSSSTTTSSIGSTSDGDGEGEERKEQANMPVILQEPTEMQLKERGLDPSLYQASLMSCQETDLNADGSIPWVCYEGVGGLRLGLFDTAVLTFYVLLRRDLCMRSDTGAENGKEKAKGKGEGMSAEEAETWTKEMAFTALVPSKVPAVAVSDVCNKEEKGDDTTEGGGVLDSDEDGDGLGEEVRVTLVTTTKTEQGP
ncbi:hypothetical protein VYU27_008437 [Nannochloropsis oceanica]